MGFMLSVAITPAYSQIDDQQSNSVNPKAQKTYRRARGYLNNREFSSAIRLLKKSIKRDSAFIAPYMALATIHYRRDSHRLRQKVLKTLVKQRPDFPNAYFNLGSDYYATQQYRAAYHTFKDFLRFDEIEERYRKIARKRRDTALFRAQQKANPVPFDPTNLGGAVNTPYSEYWPVMTTDRQTLYFTRRLEEQNKGKARQRRRFRQVRFNEDIFVSKKTDTGWEKAHRPQGNLNSGKNEGAISIAPNGNYIIFTGCQWEDTRGRCDLYMAEKQAGSWSEPRNLGPPVNSAAKETQPSISFDGQTLYFASDRGSNGRNLDIYRARRRPDGTWGKPKSLGKPINTGKTEQSPFIHADNETLFFSSKGHRGMGRSDLFYARKQADGGFGEPQNLGYPINTLGEDIGLFVSSDGATAYFASQKPDQGKGKLDIYRFKLPKAARAQKVTYVKGKVEDAITRQNLQARVRIRDLSSGEVMVKTQSARQSGRFMLPLQADHNYAVAITKKGYLLHSENLSLKRYDSAKPYQLDVALTPIEKGKQEQLSNIFFDLDKHTLKATSKAELKELSAFLQQHPSVAIEVQGHTDNQGSKSYNQQLSRKRAKAVYNYLTKKAGISRERLTYKGYGQSQPIAANDNETGRARNRRTTFEIVSFRE